MRRHKEMIDTHLKHNIGNIDMCLATLPTCPIHKSCKCMYIHANVVYILDFMYQRYVYMTVLVIYFAQLVRKL